MFGRINSQGNVTVFNSDGSVATKIDANVYPIGSGLSARYEHAQGIELSIEDAMKIELEIE